MEAALRWSPHSKDDDQRFLVVDVTNADLTLNQVDSLHGKTISYHPIARCGRLPNFGAFDWSKTDESIIALGLVSGSASLVKFCEDGDPSKIVATFKVRQQRKCNTIALSTKDWLAVGVDKTRSDTCLFIYDASRGATNSFEAVRKLCAAELVSSVRFFPSQPQEIVASTQRQNIRILDLRDAQTGSGSNMQASTRNVNNIAIDPMDENYFASAGMTDEPFLSVWDKRWMSPSLGGSSGGAVFEFKPAVNNTIPTTLWSLRYSGQKRGRLAVCSSAGELKVIDMVEGCASIPQPESLPVNPFGGQPWSNNRYVSEMRSLERPWHHKRYGREAKDRIIAFDWARDGAHGTEQTIVTFRPSFRVDILKLSSAKSHANITSRQDLSVAFDDITLTEPKVSTTATFEDAANESSMIISSPEDFGPREYEGEHDIVHGTNDAFIRGERDLPKLARILGPSAVRRERVKRGYLFDCLKNMEICTGNWQLVHLWEFILRFQELAEQSGMVCGGLDFSYIGVSGVWSEKIGNSPHRRLRPSPMKTGNAIIGLNAARNIPAFEGERTNFPEHRQLCLAVCGWKFTVDTLEAECQELIDRKLYYQAIVQAVLHDYKHIALNILRSLIRSKTIANIGLGALLASDRINEEQQEMCLWMAADTDDPALKALLTFLITGNWRDVMKTSYLHLGYRVALGLKYLNDTELSGFIQSETARAIKNGDLEGVLLTGLGEQAMDLFQTYITRTNDLQTAVLATAFTNPLYVDDVRWEMWKETYFMQMQTWRTFVERTMFTVKHNRMARTRDGKSLIEPAPAQVTLRCMHCSGSVAQSDGHYVSGQTPENKPNSTAVRVPGPPANAGTVCPRCGRHMPRCGICHHWLGTPNPSTARGAKELSKLDNIMSKLITFCRRCGHGFHADHAKMWFGKHGVCPVPDCKCACTVQ